MVEAELDLSELFDTYVLKFLDNFPMVKVEKTKISNSEMLVSVKITEPELQEYTIHIKKKE